MILLSLSKDVFICFVEISPASSCHIASRDNLWIQLEEEIGILSREGDIILAGDLNTRTGTLPDYVPHDSCSHLPLPPHYKIDDQIPRFSEDLQVNNFGRQLLQLCIATQMRIVNGRIFPDIGKGAYTCFTPRGNSVVDYVITSVDSFKNFTYSEVSDISHISDHCPISFQFSTETSHVCAKELNSLSLELLNEAQERSEPPRRGLNHPWIQSIYPVWKWF